jgi:hypothetical protein
MSVQGFAFRGRALSPLVACAFPAGVFALPSNQLLEGPKQMKLYSP